VYQLKVRDHFDAAHYIQGYVGKCQRVHGHRWDVEVCLKGEVLNGINMLVDFVFVKKWFKEILDDLDHYLLNEQLQEFNVTAEFLSRLVFFRFEGRVGKFDVAGRVKLVSVTIWESPDCSVTYSKE
jgi:6-pyruvoyltetrahydropterin/6-carboxytetrahydropterin synthase